MTKRREVTWKDEKASGQIAEDISLINSASADLSSNSSHVNANAEELSSLAERLSTLVGQFKMRSRTSNRGTHSCNKVIGPVIETGTDTHIELQVIGLEVTEAPIPVVFCSDLPGLVCK